MAKIITLKLNDDVYKKIAFLAKANNRPVSNFIQTMTMEHIEELEFVDDIEMNELENNVNLMTSLQKAHDQVKSKKGRFV